MTIATSPRGPLIVDLAGCVLTPEEKERLTHPLIGGVILFARNFETSMQLQRLTREIRELRQPPLLICVDHEGGRVQRFRAGFTPVPPMRKLGEIWDADVKQAVAEATRWGGIIADELLAHGLDFSFTPVLDLDYGSSKVIGDRAFHHQPNAVAHLANALCLGLRQSGCASVAKHFPGHGFVAADSHTEIPVDDRLLVEIEKADLIPFSVLIHRGLEAVMPAHVIYSKVDPDRPAGFSRVWLQDILRTRMDFDGLIFSDDLCMAGAKIAGDIEARADAAVGAGCDMILVCNDSTAVSQLLDRWTPGPQPDLYRRVTCMAATLGEGRSPVA